MSSADDLYALPPEEFTKARNELAKRLRKEGERDEAARVAKLRRPSATVFALNEASRREPDLLEAALAAGRALRDATQAAVSGDTSSLRAATAEERAAANRFLAAAAEHLRGSGGQSAHDRLAATLRAAAVDDAVADALRRGVLAEDRQSSGFEFAAGFAVDLSDSAPARKPKKKPTRKRSSSSTATMEDEAGRHEDAEALQAEAQAEEHRRQREELEAEVARLEASAEERREEASRAESTAEEARARAQAAEAALREARQRLADHEAAPR